MTAIFRSVECRNIIFLELIKYPIISNHLQETKKCNKNSRGYVIDRLIHSTVVMEKSKTVVEKRTIA